MWITDFAKRQRTLMEDYDYDDRMKAGLILAIFITSCGVIALAFPGTVAVNVIFALFFTVGCVIGFMLCVFVLMVLWANILRLYDTKIKG